MAKAKKETSIDKILDNSIKDLKIKQKKRKEKVSELKKLIQSGKYKIDSLKVAKKIEKRIRH